MILDTAVLEDGTRVISQGKLMDALGLYYSGNLSTAHVVESHQGKTVWEGDVSVFDVDHAEASTAYAWADPVPGSDRLRYFAVLGKPPIDSAML